MRPLFHLMMLLMLTFVFAGSSFAANYNPVSTDLSVSAKQDKEKGAEDEEPDCD